LPRNPQVQQRLKAKQCQRSRLIRPGVRDVPDIVDWMFAAGIVLVIGKSILATSFFYSGQVLSATLLSSMLSFLLVSRSLRARGISFERIFISLTAVVSGIWLYEIFYHYGYVSNFSAVFENLLTWNIDTGVGTYFPLSWAMIIVVLPMSRFRLMTVNRWFLTCVALSLLLYGIWVSIGYPQWLYPGSFFGSPIFKISSDSTALYGLVFNSITKFTVALIPASLFISKRREVPTR